MTLRGFDIIAANTLFDKGLRNPLQCGDAESGATATSTPIDPQLDAVVTAWPTLPEAIRRAILAMLSTLSPRVDL
jgi:hypothetical protein